jgi:hypothetical protein
MIYLQSLMVPTSRHNGLDIKGQAHREASQSWQNLLANYPWDQTLHPDPHCPQPADQHVIDANTPVDTRGHDGGELLGRPSNCWYKLYNELRQIIVGTMSDLFDKVNMAMLWALSAEVL